MRVCVVCFKDMCVFAWQSTFNTLLYIEILLLWLQVVQGLYVCMIEFLRCTYDSPILYDYSCLSNGSSLECGCGLTPQVNSFVVYWCMYNTHNCSCLLKLFGERCPWVISKLLSGLIFHFLNQPVCKPSDEHCTSWDHQHKCVWYLDLMFGFCPGRGFLAHTMLSFGLTY